VGKATRTHHIEYSTAKHNKTQSQNRIAKTLPDAAKFVRAMNRCVPSIANLFVL